MPDLLRCLLVDDERLARLELTALLRETGRCEVVGEAANVQDGLDLLRKTKPDVLFLDVEMPGANGFDLLAKIPHPPLVVFVTAYTDFAVRAFSVQATDYILKPVSPARMQQCIDLLQTRLKATSEQEESLFLTDREGGRFVPLSAIFLLRAYDHYVRIYHDKGNHMLREKLSVLENRLPKTIFFRANRSEIIRLESITTVEKRSRGRYALTLPGGEEVTVSEKRAIVLRRQATFDL